jgi:hypothetical protein
MCIRTPNERDVGKLSRGSSGLRTQEKPGDGASFGSGPAGDPLSLDLAAILQFPGGPRKVASDRLPGGIQQLRIRRRQHPLRPSLRFGARVNLESDSLRLQHCARACRRIDGLIGLLGMKSRDRNRSRNQSRCQNSHGASVAKHQNATIKGARWNEEGLELLLGVLAGPRRECWTTPFRARGSLQSNEADRPCSSR